MHPQEEIYTVSELTSVAKNLLEEHFLLIWVEGEISNFAAPQSGHWYFSLKDSRAQVRAAMFKGSQRRVNFTPKDGMHIMVRAKVSLYENRGDFQLIAEEMEERGEGKLLRAFLELKAKLEAAGLFAESNKKPIPIHPKCIGIITSKTGAAIKDVLTVLKRRAPFIPIVIYPTLVQGNEAAPAIVKAIQTANKRNECDVLIVTRGGGSLEDLWSFNEEIVANAIFHSMIPIISAVGHEIDFTIADFVSDLRAPTPSAAAELVSIDQAELRQQLFSSFQHLARMMQQKIKRDKQQLEWMQKHLLQQHPKRRLLEQAQRLDMYEMSLINHITRVIAKHKAHLSKVASTLDAISPLATLSRGYAIALDANQHILHSIKHLNVGNKIEVRLKDGSLDCEIIRIQ